MLCSRFGFDKLVAVAHMASSWIGELYVVTEGPRTERGRVCRSPALLRGGIPSQTRSRVLVICPTHSGIARNSQAHDLTVKVCGEYRRGARAREHRTFLSHEYVDCACDGSVFTMFFKAEIVRGLNRKSYKSSRIMASSQDMKSVSCSSRVQGSSCCS